MPEPKIAMKALKPHMGKGGGIVAIDAGYELTSEHEALEHVMKGIGERLSPPAPAEGESPTEDTKASSDTWTLQMEPDAYLKKYGEKAQYGDAAHAEIARRAAAAEKK